MTAPSPEAKQRWINNNQEKVRAQRRRTYLRHREDRLERARAYGPRWYAENRERKLAAGSVWRAANSDRMKELNRRWKAENPGKCRANVRKYQISLIKRTPQWADLAQIKAVYIEAARLNMDVDHILPLRGRYVSGLHVTDNLQLLPHLDNCRKNNRYVSF